MMILVIVSIISIQANHRITYLKYILRSYFTVLSKCQILCRKYSKIPTTTIAVTGLIWRLVGGGWRFLRVFVLNDVTGWLNFGLTFSARFVSGCSTSSTASI